MKTEIQIDHIEWNEWRLDNEHGALGRLNELLAEHGVTLTVPKENHNFCDYLHLIAESKRPK